jgi:hypothetical protein
VRTDAASDGGGRLDRASTTFIVIMTTMCCTLMGVVIWAIIRLVLHYT